MNRVLALVMALAVGAQGSAAPISPAEAASHVGQAVAVQGRVTTVTVLDKDHTILINFGKAYPNQTFTAVIADSLASRFPDMRTLVGKTVIVRGTVRLRNKKPAIVLQSPDQLGVVV